MSTQEDTAFERSTVEVAAGDVARFDLAVPDGATGTLTAGRRTWGTW